MSARPRPVSILCGPIGRAVVPAAVLVVAFGACTGAPLGPGGAPAAPVRGTPTPAPGVDAGAGPAWSAPRVLRPRVRTGGPRMPAFSGLDPAASGRVERAAGIWVRAAEQQKRSPALVRTAHVVLFTDAPFGVSEAVARAAERHVVLLVAAYGDELDLYVPHDPLPVVLHRERRSFAGALTAAAPGHPGWGAFYDATSGAVHVSLEPAPRGALPWVADLRHEMTHQVLDLSRPASDRRALLQDGGLWLWEGFAAAAETLGDGPGDDTGRWRRLRFQERRRRGEVDPLATLFRLDAVAFEGRHYDQAAQVTAFLLTDGVPGGRRAVLETLAARLDGDGRPGDLERRLGRRAPAIEVAWRAHAGDR